MNHSIQIKLSDELLRAAKTICAEEDITTGQLVRDLLAKEINRRRKARSPIRADERLLAPLRARLAPEFAAAQNWSELQNRLKRCGYTLQPAGGGLALHIWPDGTRVCKASELGFGYSRLIQRFRAAFPGHAHTWLAERILATDAVDDPDFCPIEPV